MGPIAIRACLRCGGAWFPKGGLKAFAAAGGPVAWKLVDHLRGARVAEPPPPGSVSDCPECGMALLKSESPTYKGVEIGACIPCKGHWLTATALEKLAGALTAQEQRGVAQEPAKLRSRDPTKVTAPPLIARENGHSTNITRRCPGCEQPNDPSAAVCWACGNVLGPRTTGTCPRCLGNRQGIECGGVSVEICSGCGGAWIQEGRLSALHFQDEAAREELLWEARRIRSGRLKKVQYELFCPKDALILLAKPIGMLTRTPILTCPQCQSNFIDFQNLPEFLGLDPNHPAVKPTAR
jgi:Zn-finger nucleic acid-binding protein